MKLFTRLSALVLTLLFIGSMNAQTYDLQVSDVSTAANSSDQIPAGIEAPISMTIKNNGSNAIPANTEFWLAILVNFNYHVAPDTYFFTTAFAAGAEITLTSTADWEFDPAYPSAEICGAAYFVDSTSEANPANNYYCETYSVTSAINNDWAATSISIEIPENVDGFDLDNNTETVPPLDSAVGIVTNNSDITFPLGYNVNFRLSLDGDTFNVIGTSGNEITPGYQLVFPINNQNILPEIPQDSGTYDFCLIMNEESDNTDSNNVTCETFTIIDSYDPFHPSNWPAGEEEVNVNPISIIPVMDVVRIENVVNPTEVTVTDVQGRVLRMKSISENAQIDLSTESSGVYFIKASDPASGQLEIHKFSKP